jgi:hypothetical protein
MAEQNVLCDEMHVDVDAWKLYDYAGFYEKIVCCNRNACRCPCLKLFDFLDAKNKLCAETEMMLMSLLEFWDGNRLQQNFMTVRVIKMK